MGFSLSDTTNLVIGNIPHKVAFRTWAADNMFEMPEKIKVLFLLIEILSEILS